MNIVPMQPYDVVEVSAAYKVRETKRRPARLLLAGWELSDDGKEGGVQMTVSGKISAIVS